MTFDILNDGADDPLKAALDEFQEAWFAGNSLDPEAFCRAKPECMPELLKRINAFVIAASPAPAAPPESTVLGKTLGNFRVIREIGRGGMGTVYEAEQISMKRKVALKVLRQSFMVDKTAIDKFLRERVAGGRQSHPAIVSFFDYGQYEDYHYIAQELVEGGVTLADKLAEHRAGDQRSSSYFRYVAQLMIEIAAALQHSHQAGVIHRDIKPSNILITEEGRPKITDFGIARIEDAPRITQIGEIAGTLYYMSPEQTVSKNTEIDKRTDIFSLGVTLYEMLTFELPFQGDTTIEVFRKIMITEPTDPHRVDHRVPEDLSAICMKAMEKSPGRRFASMDEFSTSLQCYLKGEPLPFKPAGVGTKAWKRVKRNPVVSMAIGAALVSMISFLGYTLLFQIPRLEDERDRAIAAERVADQRAQEIQRNYDQIMRLSDLWRLSDLEADADRLWPAYPDKVTEYEEWLVRAEDVLGRLDEHQQTLLSLRENALHHGDVACQEARVADRHTWAFEDVETQWQHDMVASLVSGLLALENAEHGLIRSIKDRLEFASTIEEKSIDAFQDLWDEAINSIANEEECPRYHGLVMEPMVGFVPIGLDPSSGLWEFAHLQTGEIPWRDIEGELILTRETGLVFVLIPGGSFNMGAVPPSDDNPSGSPNVDPDAMKREAPVHHVTLKPFLLSKYEMTQGQWFRFTRKIPSDFNPNIKTGGSGYTLLHPVEQVSWNDCSQVLFRLKLRIPSEAEWEYAARAGTTTVFWTGDEVKSLQGSENIADLTMKRFFSKTVTCEEVLSDGYATHAPVGTYKPNAFGLHDIHGNVKEWCQDVMSDYKDTPNDGAANEKKGSYRINRGGCWNLVASFGRSSMRLWDNADKRVNTIGIRPASSCAFRDYSD